MHLKMCLDAPLILQGNVAGRAAALCNALDRCAPADECLISSAITGQEEVAMDFWCVLLLCVRFRDN